MIRKILIALTAALFFAIPAFSAGCSVQDPETAAPALSYEEIVAKAKEASGSEAEALYKEAAVLDPSREEALRGLLSLYTENGEQEAAAEQIKALESAEHITTDDYVALYDIYSSLGKAAEATDTLERAYILTGDERFSELLSAYDASILPGGELFTRLSSLMEEGDGEEAAKLVLSEEWKEGFKTRIPGDKRVKQDGLRAICTEQIQKAWLLKDGELEYLAVSPEGVLFGSAGFDGAFNGVFTVKYCTVASGDVYSETGSFKEGVCEGEIASDVLWGEPDPEGEALSLFSSDMSGAVHYTGEFLQGAPVMPELNKGAKAEEEGAAIYAFNEDLSDYLCLPGATVFSFTDFGFEAYPEW